MSYQPLTKSQATVASNIDSSILHYRSGNISEKSIEEAIDKHGLTKGGSIIIANEFKAAEESEVTRIYITWAPNSYCQLTKLSYEGIRDGT